MAELPGSASPRPTSRRLTWGCSARPPVDGLGTLGGFKLQVEDHANLGYPALQTATLQLIGAALAQTNEISQALSTFRASVPQVYLDVDRAKAESMHVPLDAVWDTLSIYLGSLVRQRFHPLWPAVPRDRAGRRAVPGQAERREEPQDPQRQRRHGAAGHAGAGARTSMRPCWRAITTCIPPPKSPATPRRASAPAMPSASWRTWPTKSCRAA